MATVATEPTNTTDLTDTTTSPTAAEIESVARGIDDDLVAAAAEDLDDDLVIASLQADRDRLAARGDFDAAHAHHQQVLDLRATQAAAARAEAFEAMCDASPTAGEVEA